MITQKFLSISLLGTEWILCILILFSIISWAIILERFIFLKRKIGDVPKMESKIQGFLQQGELGKTLQVLEGDPSSPASVAAKLIRHVTKKWIHVEEYMAIVLSQEKLQLESRIAFLGTIVSIAPFVGLLGTVLGIINAFHGLSLNKQGGDLVMAGVSEALVATALGLFIAIPAAAAYNYFVRMVKKIIVSSENFSRFLLISFFSAEEARKKHVLSSQKS